MIIVGGDRQDESLVLKFANEFYSLSLEELHDKLAKLPRWPSERRVVRIVSREEALKRLASAPLRVLVAHGFTGILTDAEERLYPVRIPDVIMGIDSSKRVADARLKLEIQTIMAKIKHAPRGLER